MTQDDLFDREEADRRAQRGKRAAAQGSPRLLELARQAARHAAMFRDEITIEHVRLEMLAMGLNPADLGPAIGAVFDTDDFEPVGYTKATRPESHGRVIRTWRRKENGS